MGPRLRAAFSGHLDPAVTVPPNFSVRVATEPGHFHFLYWGGRTVVRTRDADRLLHSLLTYLSVHGDPPAGSLAFRSLAVVRDGRAVLCPPGLRHSLAKVEPVLARRGFSVVDAPWSVVDLATAELLVPEPALAVDRAALAEIVAAAPAGPRSPGVEPGRYPVAGWLFSDPDTPADVPLSRAAATARALSSLPPPATAPADALGALGRLFSRVPALAITKKQATALADSVESLVPA